MTLKISVITVTLNAATFLADCLSSVSSQGDCLCEHIIVDGGSTDATLDIIKKYAASDSRVRWISEPDNGIADAMNKGVRLATGDIITHLNSDDFYPHSQVLSTVVDCFTRCNDELWLTAGLTFVSETGMFIREIKARRYTFRRLVRGNILLHPSTFIKRDVFNRVGGFNTSLSFCMDYDLFLRLGSIVSPLTVDEQLCCFRVHSGSNSVIRADRAYAEEFQVRMDYLRREGRSTVLHRFGYYIKRHLNRMFYRNLLLAGKNLNGLPDTPCQR